MFHLGPPSPAASHARALETTMFPHVRWTATEAIGRCGAEAGDVGVATLTRTLVHRDTEGHLRWQTARSISQLGASAGHRASRPLAQCLLQRKPGQAGADVYVRCGVADAIGDLGEASGEVGARALARALESEHNEVVRQRAASSIGRLGAEFCGDVGVQALIRALGRRDEEPSVKYRVVEAMAEIGSRIGEPGAQALSRALAADQDDGVRLKAAKALGILGDTAGEKGAQALLQAKRKDTRLAVRKASEHSMLQLKADCVATLWDAVDGGSRAFSRGRAARMLGLLSAVADDRAVEALALGLLAEPGDVYLRRRCAEGLDSLGAACGPLGAVALRRVAADTREDVYVQVIASQALDKLGAMEDASRAADERLDALLEAELAKRLALRPELALALKAREQELALVATLRPEEIPADAGVAVAEDEPPEPQPSEPLQPEVPVEGELHEPPPLLLPGELPAPEEAAAETPAEESPVKEPLAEEAPVEEASPPAPLEPVSATQSIERLQAEEAAPEESPQQELSAPAPSPEDKESASEESDIVEEPEPPPQPPASEPVEEVPVPAPEVLPEPEEPTKKEVDSDDDLHSFGEDLSEDEDMGGVDTYKLGKVRRSVSLGTDRVVAAFRRLAGRNGELTTDHSSLRRALHLVGHQNVDMSLLDNLVRQNLSGRQLLDEEDFASLVASYQVSHLAMLRAQFNAADTDGSGRLSAEELTRVFRQLGITPGTGIVAEILREVRGGQEGDASFGEFTKAHTILHERGGFTHGQYLKLEVIFANHDTNKDGRVEIGDLRSCFAYQGFRLDDHDVQKLVAPILADRPPARTLEGAEHIVQGLTEVEFLRAAREAREAEAQRLLRAFGAAASADVDGVNDEVTPAVSVQGKELPGLLLELGHAPLLPEHVKEFLKVCGFEENAQLKFEDLVVLLEAIREAEGFSKAERKEIAEVFARSDADGSGSISGLELGPAMRFLGFPSDFETVQRALGRFDIDETGELNDREFLMLIGGLRKAEIDVGLRHIVAYLDGEPSVAMDDGGDGREAQGGPASLEAGAAENAVDKRGSGSAVISARFAKVPSSELPEVLRALGHTIPELEDSQVLRRAMSLPTPVDHWGLSRMVAEFRAERREEMQKYRGFATAEVKVLRKQFSFFDPEGTGSISDKHLHKLLEMLFANLRNSAEVRARASEFFKAVDEDKSGTIEFLEFLSLIREVHAEATKRRIEKERLAVQATGFSRNELKEFRDVFHMFDADGSGDMQFEELQQMCRLLVGDAADTMRGVTDLQKVLDSHDQDGNKSLDFPEFLHVLRTLVDRNWCDIATKLAAVQTDSE